MKHPSPEDWIPYVSGETTPETNKSLRQHLEQCAECRSQIQGWQRSVRRLPAWKVPRSLSRSPAFASRVRWAAAAALILGLGFVGGRFSAVPAARAEVATLRAEMERMEARVTAHSQGELEQVADSLLDAVTNARMEDREVLRLTLQRIQQRQTRDVFALREDLETVAASADDEIQQARLDLATPAAKTDLP